MRQVDQQGQRAANLNAGQHTEPGVGQGLEKLHQHPPAQIGHHEQLEAVARPGQPVATPGQQCGQRQAETDFVQLSRVAGDAVTIVPGPGQVGWRARRAILNASQEATQPANGQTEQQRINEQIAGGAAIAQPALDGFHCEPAADETAGDGLAADQLQGMREMGESGGWILQPPQHPRAQCGANDGR